MVDVLRMQARPDGARAWVWSLRIGSLFVFAAIWELLGRMAHSLLLPACTETLIALGNLVTSPSMWAALWTSNQAMLLGYGLAVSVGVPLGFLMSRSRTAERMIDPYLSILLVTPIVALIPLVIMAMGLGLLSRVLIVFSFAVVHVTLNARAGLRSVEPEWIEMARAFGATERQLWHKVLVRAALPAILAGLRVGLMRAISGMIAVELLLVAVGVGRLILVFQGNLEAANLYAAVLIVMAEPIVLLSLFDRLERRAAFWARAVSE